jgi:hypothetical protein
MFIKDILIEASIRISLNSLVFADCNKQRLILFVTCSSVQIYPGFGLVCGIGHGKLKKSLRAVDGGLKRPSSKLVF